MVRNSTAVLVAVLLLASSGIASAQSTRTPQRVFASPGFNGVFASPGFNGVCLTPATTSGTAICQARPATTNTA
jgi:hypothetical protein